MGAKSSKLKLTPGCFSKSRKRKLWKQSKLTPNGDLTRAHSDSLAYESPVTTRADCCISTDSIPLRHTLQSVSQTSENTITTGPEISTRPYSYSESFFESSIECSNMTAPKAESEAISVSEYSENDLMLAYDVRLTPTPVEDKNFFPSTDAAPKLETVGEIHPFVHPQINMRKLRPNSMSFHGRTPSLRSPARRFNSVSDDLEMDQKSEINLMMKNAASIKLTLLQLKRLLSDDTVKIEDLAEMNQFIAEEDSAVESVVESPDVKKPTRTKSLFQHHDCYLDSLNKGDLSSNLKQIYTENKCLMSILQKKDVRIAELEAKLKAASIDTN